MEASRSDGKLSDAFECGAEEFIKIIGSGGIFGDGLRDGLFCGGALVAKVDQGGEDIFTSDTLDG